MHSLRIEPTTLALLALRFHINVICNTGMNSLECLICALFDKTVFVFVFFSVFHLISLENRAELICSPAVSLSLNYAEAKD